MSVHKAFFFTGSHLFLMIYVAWLLVTNHTVFWMPHLEKRVIYNVAGQIAHLHLRKMRRNLTLVLFTSVAFVSVP